MEFLASYDFEISYTLGKGNVVADALSRQRMAPSPPFVERKNLKFISAFDFKPSIEILPDLFAFLEIRPTLMDQIGASLQGDPQILDIMEKLKKGGTSSHLSRYAIDEKGWLRRDGRLCVPQSGSLIKAVLEEAHHSKMTIHPGGDKMYRDMKRVFFWAGMKKDVAEFVSQCLVCQQSKLSKRSLVDYFVRWRFRSGNWRASLWIS